MEPYVIGHDDGQAIWMFDALDTVKADAHQTGGAFTLFEILDFEGSTVPLHFHQKWDRGFFVLEGHYTFFIGEKVIPSPPGSWVFIPRATPHAWRCDSSQGRLLNITVPGGLEDFYREVGQSVVDRKNLPLKSQPDFDTLGAAAATYGIVIVGPPPQS